MKKTVIGLYLFIKEGW